MSFYDNLRKKLTPELFTQVTDELGDDFDFDLVPRSRLNKVIKQRNELRDQIAEGAQPKGGKDEDDDDFEMPKGKKKTEDKEVNIEELKKQWLAEQEDAVSGVKIQYAALDKLRAANAIDPEVIWAAGLIDKTKLTLAEDGKTVTGLDEAITELTKNKANLFGNGKKDVPGGTGKNGGEDGTPPSVSTKEEFLKLSTADQLAFKQANPEVFKTFLNS